MKRLIWLITLLITALPVYAQGEPVYDIFGSVDVTNVTLTRTEDNQISLTIYGTPATCSPVVVEQEQRQQIILSPDLNTGSLIDVDLFTDPPQEGKVCQTLVASSHVVELEGAFETDQSYILTINNFTAWVYLVRPGQTVMDMELQHVDVGDTELVGWLNSEPVITNIVWGASAERHVINVQGNLPDGCIGALMSYIEEDAVNPALVHVNLFRVLPLAVMCPAEPAQFHASIETNIFQTAEVVIEIDSNLYQNVSEGPLVELMLVTMRLITVESVTIKGAGGSYQVEVIGTQNGDCGVPLHSVSGVKGAVSVIHIFDLVTEPTPCTCNLIPYDNTFTVSALPVVVNGAVYFAENTSGAVPTEGDVMQIGTVIENVEVLVAE